MEEDTKNPKTRKKSFKSSAPSWMPNFPKEAPLKFMMPLKSPTNSPTPIRFQIGFGNPTAFGRQPGQDRSHVIHRGIGPWYGCSKHRSPHFRSRWRKGSWSHLQRHWRNRGQQRTLRKRRDSSHSSSGSHSDGSGYRGKHP